MESRGGLSCPAAVLLASPGLPARCGSEQPGDVQLPDPLLRSLPKDLRQAEKAGVFPCVPSVRHRCLREEGRDRALPTRLTPLLPLTPRQGSCSYGCHGVTPGGGVSPGQHNLNLSALNFLAAFQLVVPELHVISVIYLLYLTPRDRGCRHSEAPEQRFYNRSWDCFQPVYYNLNHAVLLPRPQPGWHSLFSLLTGGLRCSHALAPLRSQHQHPPSGKPWESPGKKQRTSRKTDVRTFFLFFLEERRENRHNSAKDNSC